MWLRDSAAQMKLYVRFAGEDVTLQTILESVIEKQAQLVCIDPYANAFNESANGRGYQDDTRMTGCIRIREDIFYLLITLIIMRVAKQRGLEAPHTFSGHVWHIGIVMQALTSSDREEILMCLYYLTQTHAGTNFMHEAFDPDRPEVFSRPWFAWANTLFAELLENLMEENFF